MTQSWRATITADGATYGESRQLVQNKSGRVLVVDTALGVYYVEPLAPPTPRGVEVPTLQITDLGREKMLGYETRHFAVDVEFAAMTGFPGKSLSRQELWVLPAAQTPGVPAHLENFRGVTPDSLRGDTKSWDELQGGLPVRTVRYDLTDPAAPQFKPLLTEELASLTFTTVAPETFAVPANLREVTREAWQEQRRQLRQRPVEPPVAPKN